ncbi:hypothetical protein Goari_026134, partial [Gossypium aridum]|nr:hypothetical protein [Gossypium aridum]
TERESEELNRDLIFLTTDGSDIEQGGLLLAWPEGQQGDRFRRRRPQLFSTPCVLHVYLSLLTFLVLTSSFLPFNQSLSTSIEGGAKWLVNKIKGKMQKPLPELLREYNLPIGIFPRDATNYEFNEETGKLTVFIPAICEVGYKDSSVLRFFTTVTGYLEKGKLADIEGMKTKVMIWVKVTSITCEGSKIYVTAGMKKSRNREAYEVSRDGVSVDKF